MLPAVLFRSAGGQDFLLHCDLTLANPARPRVCAVSYLNTVPLVWGMLDGPQKGTFDLQFAAPSECADRLADLRADIGIVPCAEIGRLRLEPILDVGIACDGPVRSILLISRVAPAQIRTLAADVSSRTSVQLARILLSKRYGAHPALTTLPPDLPSMLEKADAALIIGDPALHLDPNTLPFHVLDLGAEWRALTDLPMVFAVWAGRSGAISQGHRQAFLDSCRYGLRHIDAIAASEAPLRGIAPELAHEYLTRHIRFELGAREIEGMETFARYCAALSMKEVGV